MLRCTETERSPPASTKLRAKLKKHHGGAAGARRFVKVSQLLLEHPIARVRQAIEACLREQLLSVEAVIRRTHTWPPVKRSQGATRRGRLS